MPSVIFLRAVNVGGHQKFQPSLLAKGLAEFDVVNIGAAGTFVVRQNVSPAKLRAEIQRRLPFQPEMMICPAKEIVALAQSHPFPDRLPPNSRPFVTVMASVPRKLPPLPLDQRPGPNWEVRILAVRGRFAFSLWRHQGRALLYPNA